MAPAEWVGVAAATATLTTIMGGILLRLFRRHFIVPREQHEAQQEARWAVQLQQIKDLLGVNGVPVTVELSNAIDSLRREVQRCDTTMGKRLDRMAVGEMLHRTQGFAIAKQQHAAARQAGITGWPDPEHFRGMLGVEEEQEHGPTGD